MPPGDTATAAAAATLEIRLGPAPTVLEVPTLAPATLAVLVTLLAAAAVGVFRRRA